MSFLKKYSNFIIVVLIILVLILLLIIFTDVHVAKINREIKQASVFFLLSFDRSLTKSISNTLTFVESMEPRMHEFFFHLAYYSCIRGNLLIILIRISRSNTITRNFLWLKVTVSSLTDNMEKHPLLTS